MMVAQARIVLLHQLRSQLVHGTMSVVRMMKMAIWLYILTVQIEAQQQPPQTAMELKRLISIGI